MQRAISVIIATHNKTSRLEKTLWSLIHQERTDFDVIVANDGGDVATQLLCTRLGGRLDLRHLWAAPPGEPIGAAAARNRAILYAGSPRILVIDDDCIAPPDLIGAHAATQPLKSAFGLRRHLGEETHCVLTEADMHRLSSLPWRKEVRDNAATLDRIHSRVANQSINIRSYLWTCHISYPAAAFNAVGGFWEEMHGSGHEDQELAVRLFRAGVRFVFLDSVAVYHQDHPQCQHQARCQQHNRQLLNQTLRSSVVARRGSVLLPH